MDGEDEREAMQFGGPRPCWEYGKVLAEVDVYHVGPRRKERG